MNTDNTEAKLKELILKKYKHLAVFCKKINMPWTTLNSILDRGIQKSSFSNILKIAAELNLDAGKLAEGQVIECNASEQLSSEDVDFLVTYHLLDEYGKAAVDETLQREKKRCIEMNTLKYHKLIEP